jgi:serine/threonine protein kinase
MNPENTQTLPPTGDGAAPTTDGLASAPAAEAAAPPQLAGSRYRPLCLHARGGLGEVYLARDQECDREVALKTVQTSRDDNAGRARFLREAVLTARLQHPGIVPVYGLGAAADGRPQYAMRFITGETLTAAVARLHAPAPSRLDDAGPLEGVVRLLGKVFGDEQAEKERKEREAEHVLALRRLLPHVVAAANAVAYAHSEGVIHRDLKPDNVMLGPFGETLVVDWGLARVFGRPEEDSPPAAAVRAAELTQPGDVLGTPAFMSPEQAAGRHDEVGPASDVYSLGATLYVVLTGEPPVHGNKLDFLLARVRRGEFPPPRSVKPSVPPGLDAICRKAMALRPGDRYPSAAAFAADLGRWLADERVIAWREPWREWARRLRRKHASFLAGLMITLTLLAALAPKVLQLGRYAWRHLHSEEREAVERAQQQTATAVGRTRQVQKALADLMRTYAREKEVGEKKADLHRQVSARLERLGAACLRACDRLGRPAKGLAELTPHLKDPADLLVPGGDRPFVIAWGVHPIRGASPLAWEPTAGPDGSRWALFPGASGGVCAHVGARAFDRLEPAPPQPARPGK